MQFVEVENTNEITKMILSALIGGSGLCGIVFLFIKRYIENRLSARERREEEALQLRMRRRIIDDEMQHATGRLFFWIVKAIETGDHNGDLQNAFQEFRKAEEESKNLDREILAREESG